jgi:hypothetical protein
MLTRLPGLGTSIDEVMRQPEGERLRKIQPTVRQADGTRKSGHALEGEA